MKNLKKFLVPTLGAVAAISLASCGNTHVGEPNNGITKNEDGTYTVRVGNTNAAALLPTVFGPMEYGFQAYAWYYGAHETKGQIKIDYTHLDDGYVPAVRAVNTEQLLGADKNFGIVYSYVDQGSLLDQYNKVEVYTPLTMDYYAEEGESVPSFPIQPIDYVEGEHLIASAFATEKKGGLGGTKVGVLAGISQTGTDEVKAIRATADKLGKKENTDYFVQTLENAATSDPTAAVNALKSAGCDVVIMTDCNTYFATALAAMKTANWSNVKVLASYKLSNALYFGAAYSVGFLADGRRLFTPGWIAAGVQSPETYDEWAKYVEVLTLYSKSVNDGLITTEAAEKEKLGGSPEVVKELVEKYDWAKDGVSTYFYDSYTMAGYIGMYVFAEGLTYLNKAKLLDGASTEDYVAVMEKNGMHIPMSTIDVSLEGGRRTGAQAFTLVECTVNNYSLGEAFRTFKTTAELLK